MLHHRFKLKTENTEAKNRVTWIGNQNSDETGETQITLKLTRGNAHLIRPGKWKITLRGIEIEDGRYDAWIERMSRKKPYKQARFTSHSAEGSRTVSIPGTARKIITVGSYSSRPQDNPANTGNISNFSSRGPTRLGSLKPDITAPGESIIAARSSASSKAPNPDNLHTMVAGTSMAAPHVAGVAALILSERPNRTADEVKQILVKTARTDSYSDSGS